jgi:hypothetical protein
MACLDRPSGQLTRDSVKMFSLSVRCDEHGAVIAFPWLGGRSLSLPSTMTSVRSLDWTLAHGHGLSVFFCVCDSDTHGIWSR